jgi:uncharacterized NAD(P)/FAD-binding protein YdhS
MLDSGFCSDATGATVPLVIVGGGAAGCLVALTVARLSGGRIRPVIVDPSAHPGEGVAYGLGTPRELLLNVPAGGMALCSDAPDAFLDWARSNGPRMGWPEAAQANAGDYLPRRLFGAYVRQRVQEARASDALVHLRTVAVGLRRTTGHWRVSLGDGTELKAESVVLALGNMPPRRPYLPDPDGVLESPLFRNDPWDAMAPPLPDAPTLLLGSGLTMVDWALHLGSDNSRRAPVYAVSRRGLLPLRRGTGRPAEPLFEAADANAGLVTLLRRLKNACRAAGDDWRAVIDGLRPASSAVWQQLSDDDRLRFLRHAETLWNIHRHRMPEASADAIDLLRQNGQLTVLAGRVTNVRRVGNDRAAVTVALRRGGEATMVVGAIVNCTGADGNPARMAAPLVRQCLRDGILKADGCGQGFAAGPDGSLHDRNGHSQGGLYGLGVMLRGTLYECTAVPDLRAQAESLSATLLRSLLPPEVSR